MDIQNNKYIKLPTEISFIGQLYYWQRINLLNNVDMNIISENINILTELIKKYGNDPHNLLSHNIIPGNHIILNTSSWPYSNNSNCMCDVEVIVIDFHGDIRYTDAYLGEQHGYYRIINGNVVWLYK
jgi:hypothetical protein